MTSLYTQRNKYSTKTSGTTIPSILVRWMTDNWHHLLKTPIPTGTADEASCGSSSEKAD